MSSQQPLPLYDLFLDLPHPAAAASCPPARISGSPGINPEIEKELAASISRISQFAFPEYDDSLDQRIPRDTNLNRFSHYAMQPKSFQNYTFSLQLQSGVRVHGFVRRYLPIHQVVEHRYDVGRRGERALVMLTRFSGGDLLYASILKTMDAISFQKAALNSKYDHSEPQKWFLNRLFEEHKKLFGVYSSIPQDERKPMMISITSIEVGKSSVKHFNQVDTANYLVPTSLLTKVSNVESLTSSPILPLLRVLGLSSTLRLLSALLSENRVLLISANPTRLAQCARSALSILAQGLLNWQHLYIPVLPPHLFQYLGAPVPYLIGILTSYIPKLNQMNSDGLGELVIINLDTNQMETRGIIPTDVPRKIPDLFQKAISEQGMPASTMSASEMLAQDLLDLLKVDKRALYGESTLTNVSETAAKATKAVKSGISNLARKGKRFFNNRKGSLQNIDGTTIETTEEDEIDTNDLPDTDQNSMTPDLVYIQGSRNEVAEEEARIAFSSFFLSMFGNMRWYLSASPGKLPHLDRNRFLQQKRAMGEGESTAIWPLLQNFCQSQMLEQFAKARVDEVRLRLPVTSDSPLFTQCANYHRLNNIDFSVINVRRVARQVAQSNPSRLIMQTSARRTAMLLTSNKTYEGDYNKSVAHLVEQCRECTSTLFDVMSVIWVRIRDSKGVHWKHGLQALQVLRNLLYHGPLAAIAEATDGLDKIRVMKFYNENMRAQICTQIRQAAHQVYNLLVDRAKLFYIRRICANKRRLLIQPDENRYGKDSRIAITHRFGAMHQLLNPMSQTRVAPAPRSAPNPSIPSIPANEDILGLTASSRFGAIDATPSSSNATDTAQEMINLFENFDLTNKLTTASSAMPNHKDLDSFTQLPAANSPAPSTPLETLLPNTALSNYSLPVPSPARASHPRDPISQVRVSNKQTNQFSPQYSHSQHHQAQLSNTLVQKNVSEINSQTKQAYIPQQQITKGAETFGVQVAYGETQTLKPNNTAPPPKNNVMIGQQDVYHPSSSLHHLSTNFHPGIPPQGRISAEGPQQQQQSNQVQSDERYVLHQNHYQQHSTMQQQHVAQQATQALPNKPNLSQFDPFR